MATRVLVTGGAGFIGAHLVEALLARGDEVVVLDDLSTGARHRVPEGANFIEGSAADEALVRARVAESDAVVHLAAAVGVRLALEQTARTLENNVASTRAVLAAAADTGARVLLASSSEVYGRSAQVPFHEDAGLELGPTASPRWSYAVAKALDEHLALALFRERGLPVTAMRFFNVVGPGQSGEWGMVLPRFAARALAGEPLPVYGDGRQTRAFTHVRDAAEAILRLLDAERAAGQVVNVGSPREVSVLELAAVVNAAAGSTAGVEHVPIEQVYGGRFEDTPRRFPDVRRLESLTGFVPSTPLQEIVDDVVADLRSARG